MEKLTQSRKYDTSQSETDKQESGKDQLLEQRKIEDTPFTAVRMDETWFLTMGNSRLSLPYKTYEECVEDSKDASWMRIMQVIQVMIDYNNKNQNNK